LLLLEQYEVFLALEGVDQLFLLFLKGINTALHCLRGGLVAVSQHVLQACHPQVGKRGIEPGDIAHPVTAINHFVQAEPVKDRHYASEEQYQAKAKGQFQVDADVAQPAVHKVLQERCTQDRISLEGFSYWPSRMLVLGCIGGSSQS